MINNPILKSTIEFSLLIIDYCDQLPSLKKFTISNQLFRSGTPIGANSFKAQNAESKAGFIPKIKIAAKKAGETEYWLTLCQFAEHCADCNILIGRFSEVQKDFG